MNFVGHLAQGDLALGLAGFRHKLALGLDEGRAAFLAEPEGSFELLFSDFVRGAFEHHDVLAVTDVNEVQIAFSALVVRGAGNELAVDAPDANGAEGPLPRNIADGEGCRST